MPSNQHTEAPTPIAVVPRFQFGLNLSTFQRLRHLRRVAPGQASCPRWHSTLSSNCLALMHFKQRGPSRSDAVRHQKHLRLRSRPSIIARMLLTADKPTLGIYSLPTDRSIAVDLQEHGNAARRWQKVSAQPVANHILMWYPLGRRSGAGTAAWDFSRRKDDFQFGFIRACVSEVDYSAIESPRRPGLWNAVVDRQWRFRLFPRMRTLRS